jgi:hypothetical protein
MGVEKRFFRSPLASIVFLIFLLAVGISAKSAFYVLPQLKNKFDGLGQFWLYGITTSFLISIILLSFFRFSAIWKFSSKKYAFAYLTPVIFLFCFIIWAYVML